MNNKQITNNNTLDKRNPPPLMVSYAPSGDEGPTVYIQTQDRKKKQKKQSVPRADNHPGGLSNIPPYKYNRKTTNSRGKLRQRRKLGEPQSPGLKKEFPNVTLWPRTPKLKGEKTRSSPQPLRSRF
jgi:hypothetical protein